MTNLIDKIQYKTLIIVPTYNSEKSIEYVLSGLRNYNVLVVNDGSNDNTKQILINMNIPFIDIEQNRGVGYAIKSGITYAIENDYEYAITIDSDGQHDTKFIYRFMRKINNCSLIIGNRFHNVDYIPHQKISSNLFAQVLFKHIFKKKIHDVSCGYRAFKVEKGILNCTSDNYGFIYEHLILSVVNKGKIEYINIPALYSIESFLCTRASEVLGLLQAISATPNMDLNIKPLLNDLISKFRNRETVNIDIDSYLFCLFYIREYDAYIFQTDIQKAINFFKTT